MNQAAQADKSVPSGLDAPIDLLESIEHILHRLHIYTRSSPTPAMDEIVVEIVVGLLSMIALATKELKQGRSSEPFLALFSFT